MAKSILFTVNGFGMGNATRCDSLAEILQNEYQIDVVTSDRALEYFKTRKTPKNVFEQKGINLNRQFKFGSFSYFANYIPHFLKRIYSNFKLQRELVLKNRYSMIVFDSDYSFILHRIFRTPCVLIGLNNSYEVLSYFKKNPSQIKFNLLPSLLIEVLDFTVYNIFCKFVFCPSIAPEKLRAPDNFLVIPLLARRELVPHQNQSNCRALIMSSSSQIESALTRLGSNSKFKNLDFLTEHFKTDNTSLLRSASAVVCNAGQSSISESFYLNKRAFLVAIPRHAEQFANAALASQKGLCSVGSEQDLNHILARLQNETESFTPDYGLTHGRTTQLVQRQLRRIEREL